MWIFLQTDIQINFQCHACLLSKQVVHCPKNNLNLRIKAEFVTGWADVTAYSISGYCARNTRYNSKYTVAKQIVYLNICCSITLILHYAYTGTVYWRRFKPTFTFKPKIGDTFFKSIKLNLIDIFQNKKKLDNSDNYCNPPPPPHP